MWSQKHKVLVLILFCTCEYKISNGCCSNDNGDINELLLHSILSNGAFLIVFMVTLPLHGQLFDQKNTSERKSKSSCFYDHYYLQPKFSAIHKV